MSEKVKKKPRRAVRNIENAAAPKKDGGSPYMYKRESKQEAAARIERELRRAAGMSSDTGPAADPAADGEPAGDTRQFEPHNHPTGDTKVFQSLGGDRARHIVIKPDASDVEKAQREISEALQRRSLRKRRIAKTVLAVCAVLAVLALIIILTAGAR